ncbi:hypothetical protein IMZ48_34465 [Candidatus Bathyarchaeota archaeon]|nr:hypothetical protein [Candidatus Bathyarchaeota archaeon]
MFGRTQADGTPCRLSALVGIIGVELVFVHVRDLQTGFLGYDDRAFLSCRLARCGISTSTVVCRNHLALLEQRRFQQILGA